MWQRADEPHTPSLWQAELREPEGAQPRAVTLFSTIALRMVTWVLGLGQAMRGLGREVVSEAFYICISLHSVFIKSVG